MNVLIGYTGFIGSSLNQDQFNLKLNSKNWQDISEPIDVDKLVIAAPSGIKYLANREPLNDLDKCLSLVRNIIKYFRSIKTIVIISSNDTLNPTTDYGRNRQYFNNLIEEVCKIKHTSLYIMYLGMTFGTKAKKGMVYDFIHGNFNFYNGGTYQLYPVRYLEQDIQHCIDNGIHKAMLASVPIKTAEVKALWNVKDNYQSKIHYNLKGFGVPLIDKTTILKEIQWIKSI